MQIEEIGSQKKSQGIGNAAGNSELQRKAQTMAAEQLASVQAANAGGQAASNKAEIHEDAVKLSNKALSEVSTRNSADAMSRRDDLLSSLMDKLNSEIINPDSEFNKQNEKNKKAEGAGGGDNKKKKQVKKEAEWSPETEEGQIHPGRDVIGKVRVTEEVKESGGEGGGGVAGVGKTVGAKGNTKAGTPNYGKAAQNSSASEQGRQQQETQKPSDSKDDNKEAKEASAVKSLEKSGLQAPGLEQEGKKQESGDKSKIEEQAGGAGGGKVQEFEVRTRATGTSQTLEVTPPKKLQPGDGFRKFRKLDDKPMLKYATMHKQKFQGGDNQEAIKELKKNAQAAGESPEAIQQAVQRLKDRSSPDQ